MGTDYKILLSFLVLKHFSVIIYIEFIPERKTVEGLPCKIFIPVTSQRTLEKAHQSLMNLSLGCEISMFLW